MQGYWSCAGDIWLMSWARYPCWTLLSLRALLVLDVWIPDVPLCAIRCSLDALEFAE